MPYKGRKGLPRNTHGRTKTPEYRRWAAMLSRCRNPNDAGYYLYGGRGITVCAEWQNEGGFERWLAEMGKLPHPDFSIDRIDNSRGYEPGNVRWASPKQQAGNTRQAKPFTHKGVTLSQNAWCHKRGISCSTFYRRLRSGWTVAEALEL